MRDWTSWRRRRRPRRRRVIVVGSQLSYIPAHAEVRLNALQILNTLLDRHENLSKLEHLPLVDEVEDLHLTMEKCSRQDQLFMRR